MSHHNSQALGALTALRRNNYYFGKLMDVAHFQLEQSYDEGKHRLLNRLTLGDGVLCGLLAEKTEDNRVCVDKGAAIDQLGRVIIVPAKTCVDPWTITDECGQVVETLSKDEEHQVRLCLAYRECATEFAPVLVTDCNTKEECAAGTTVESFRLLVREDLSLPTHDLSDISAALFPESGDSRVELCKTFSAPCAEPQDCPCVVLGTIALNDDGTIGNLDPYTDRSRIYSNTVLLDLILCLADRIKAISNP